MADWARQVSRGSRASVFACPSCGAQNQPNVPSCWQCGAAFAAPPPHPWPQPPGYPPYGAPSAWQPPPADGRLAPVSVALLLAAATACLVATILIFVADFGGTYYYDPQDREFQNKCDDYSRETKDCFFYINLYSNPLEGIFLGVSMGGFLLMGTAAIWALFAPRGKVLTPIKLAVWFGSSVVLLVIMGTVSFISQASPANEWWFGPVFYVGAFCSVGATGGCIAAYVVEKLRPHAAPSSA